MQECAGGTPAPRSARIGIAVPGLTVKQHNYLAKYFRIVLVKRSRIFFGRFGILAALVVLGTTMAGASPFGVNAHIPKDAALDEVVNADIGWVRVDFRWSFVEPERDVYDWRKYDTLLDRIEERNLRVYATFS